MSAFEEDITRRSRPLMQLAASERIYRRTEQRRRGKVGGTTSKETYGNHKSTRYRYATEGIRHSGLRTRRFRNAPFIKREAPLRNKFARHFVPSFNLVSLNLPSVARIRLLHITITNEVRGLNVPVLRQIKIFIAPGAEWRQFEENARADEPFGKQARNYSHATFLYTRTQTGNPFLMKCKPV